MRIKYIQWKAIINNRIIQSPKMVVNNNITKEQIKRLARIVYINIIKSLSVYE